MPQHGRAVKTRAEWRDVGNSFCAHDAPGLHRSLHERLLRDRIPVQHAIMTQCAKNLVVPMKDTTGSITKRAALERHNRVGWHRQSSVLNLNRFSH